jgi:hypothetical protein
MTKKNSFDLFVESYLATAAWSTCESDECQDFTEDGKKVAMLQCAKFLDKCHQNGIKRSTVLSFAGEDLAMLAAHDFFLTRNGHGAGFWDKENIYGEDLAAKLTDIAKEMGESTPFHVRGKKSKLTF